MPRYWEDYNVGEKFYSLGRTMSETIVSVVCGLASPGQEPWVWDEEEAKKSFFGGRTAVGGLTLMMMDGLGADSLDQTTIIALLGLAGRFRLPVLIGDTIKVETEIVEKKTTKNPERGIIIQKSTCRNQRDEVVALADITTLVMARGK